MPGIARGIAYQVAPSQIVHLGRHCCPSKNRIKNRVRGRVRLGNEKERGGSRAIAESGIYIRVGLGYRCSYQCPLPVGRLGNLCFSGTCDAFEYLFRDPSRSASARA